MVSIKYFWEVAALSWRKLMPACPATSRKLTPSVAIAGQPLLSVASAIPSNPRPFSASRREMVSRGFTKAQHRAWARFCSLPQPGDGWRASSARELRFRRSEAPSANARKTQPASILGDSPLEEPELPPFGIFVNKHGSRRADLASFIEFCCRLHFQTQGNRCDWCKTYFVEFVLDHGIGLDIRDWLPAAPILIEDAPGRRYATEAPVIEPIDFGTRHLCRRFEFVFNPCRGSGFWPHPVIQIRFVGGGERVLAVIEGADIIVLIVVASPHFLNSTRGTNRTYGMGGQRRDPCFLRLARHPDCHLARPAVGPGKIRDRHHWVRLLLQFTAGFPLEPFYVARHNLDAVQKVPTLFALEPGAVCNNQV